MTEANLISAISYVFSGIGAFFLCRSYINVTPKELALQAKTFIGGNDHLLRSLVQQNSDALVGFTLTFFGVLIGFLSLNFIYVTDLISPWKIMTISFTIVLSTAIFVSKKLFRIRLRKAQLFGFSLFVDEYIPDWDQDRFKVDRIIEAIKDFNLTDDDRVDLERYERIIHLLSLSGAHHTIQKIKNFKSRNPQ